MQRTDHDIRQDILDELEWESSLRDDDIAVGVHGGVVTLGGFVDSFADKGKAEQVAGRIRGVRAVANEIEVKLPDDAHRSDTEIARAALSALQWHVTVPHERIRVKVEDGWLTLEGQVRSFAEKQAAEHAIRHLTGVRGVLNLITLEVQATPRDLRKRIKDALHRGVELDAEQITVEVVGSRAILEGTVRSYAELQDVEHAARKAPGIVDVENRLEVVAGFATA
jgi:osmotically-inducible protein OsmY